MIPLYSVPLQLRAEATTAPGRRERAARALAAVGRRLRASPAHLDRVIGGHLEEDAAKLSGDASAAAEVWDSAVSEATGRLLAPVGRLGTWPLVSVLREADPEDELADDLRGLE